MFQGCTLIHPQSIFQVTSDTDWAQVSLCMLLSLNCDGKSDPDGSEVLKSSSILCLLSFSSALKWNVLKNQKVVWTCSKLVKGCCHVQQLSNVTLVQKLFLLVKSCSNVFRKAVNRSNLDQKVPSETCNSQQNTENGTQTTGRSNIVTGFILILQIGTIFVKFCQRSTE